MKAKLVAKVALTALVVGLGTPVWLGSAMAEPAKWGRTQDGKAAFILSNGQRLPYQDNTGKPGKPDAHGVQYPDGTQVSVNSRNQTVITFKGKVKHILSAPKPVAAKYPPTLDRKILFGGKSSAPQAPSAAVQAMINSGAISAYGKTAEKPTASKPKPTPKPTTRTVTTKVVPADNQGKNNAPKLGRTKDGKAIFVMANGQALPVQDPNGNPGKIVGDTVQYPNGTRVSVNTRNQTVISRGGKVAAVRSQPSTQHGKNPPPLSNKALFGVSAGKAPIAAAIPQASVPGHNAKPSASQSNNGYRVPVQSGANGVVTSGYPYREAGSNAGSQSGPLSNPTPAARAGHDTGLLQGGVTERSPDPIKWVESTTGSMSPGERQVKTGTDETGYPIFRLTNGADVPRLGPDGEPGIVDDKGGVTYSNGDYVSPASNGGVNVRNADGGLYNIGGNATPSRTGTFAEPTVSSQGQETYTLANGRQVPRYGQDGSVGLTDNKGGVTYSDGTYVTSNSEGHTVVRYPDGSSSVTTVDGAKVVDGVVMPHATVSEDGRDTYTLSNGMAVLRHSPDGQVGLTDNKGGITYADGTYVSVNGRGNTLIIRPDGTTKEITPGGDVTFGTVGSTGFKKPFALNPGSPQQDNGKKGGGSSATSTTSSDGKRGDSHSGSSSGAKGSSGNSGTSSSGGKKGSSGSDSDSNSSHNNSGKDNADSGKTNTESGNETGDEEEAMQEKLTGENMSGRKGGKRATGQVDDLIASMRGEKRDTDVKPQDCPGAGGGNGGMVTQPGSPNAGRGNCNPTGHGIDAGGQVVMPDFERPTRRANPGSTVTQPSAPENAPVDRILTWEEILGQQDQVTNPDPGQ